MNDCRLMNEVQVPRCYFCVGDAPKAFYLHGFSDASEKAYGAVLYLSTVYSDGSCGVRLVCSKNHLCPLKKQTIP